MTFWRYARIVLLVTIIASPGLAMAAGIPAKIVPDCVTTDATKCTICDFAQLAQNILNTAIFLAVVLSAILFAWAGFIHLSAGGNPSKIGQANRVFTNVFVGLIIILSAWLIVDTLMKVMTGNGSSFGPWNSICSS